MMGVFLEAAYRSPGVLGFSGQRDALVDVEVLDRIPNNLSREIVETWIAIGLAGSCEGLGNGIVVLVHSITRPRLAPGN